jgi:hypothetical protein
VSDDIDKINHLIGNKLKLELCFILSDKKLSLNEVVLLYEQKFKKKKYRETVFRALDEMLKSKLIEKTYDSDRKKIQYGLIITGLQFNFINGHVELLNKENDIVKK